MDKITQEAYIKELTDFIKEKTGINRFLSSKEKSLIKKFYSENIPLERLKKIIESEIISYPQSKRKKFSVLSIEKKLSHQKNSPPQRKIRSEEESNNRWKKVIERLNIPPEILNVEKVESAFRDFEIERRVVSYLWKNLPENEKKKLQEEAKREIKKKFVAQNIDPKKVIKSLIYTKLKKIYNI
ncbi:MAG TPA: hypothetical protein DEP48_07750 [Persephonella sp.]|uniref:Uncharacterized protein n=1 Tax=Persephonella marina (strain DSM 14350 / EX-H1) TaxID=123214 RepID=C0QTY0_PERMH|nr:MULTISPECIES: hypothetical protein [Persephonella]ACO03177.1 conserved hypothetical protein [Persephonella marina EX-H1]HCB70238.1 hypothetical protein [Persephonella sp.]